MNLFPNFHFETSEGLILNEVNEIKTLFDCQEDVFDIYVKLGLKFKKIFFFF